MTLTRQKVTDLLTPSTTRKAELVPVVRFADLDLRDEATEQSVRECIARRIPTAATELDDSMREHLQTLINEYSHQVCVCAPNRTDMLAAKTEMQAHPGYAAYKARRDAAMAAHTPE